MSIYRLPPERILFRDHGELHDKYEKLADRYHDLYQFTLELLNRHPEEMLAFAMYSGPAPTPQQRGAQVRAERLSKANPVVYYLNGDGRVKIGVTASIVGRMADLQALPSDLLAIEPGDHGTEFARHGQFRHLRIGWTEWFKKGDDLMEHIEALRQQHPSPYHQAVELNGLRPRPSRAR